MQVILDIEKFVQEIVQASHRESVFLTPFPEWYVGTDKVLNALEAQGVDKALIAKIVEELP